MRISDVIKRKGGEVVTVAPDASVTTLLDLLAQHGIGAVVVSPDGVAVAGIVSERDVVRRLQSVGAGALDLTVADIMTSDVRTCGPHDALVDLMSLMTTQRVRHVPVVVEGRLTGIISIGDVVKHRMDELLAERDQLVGYLQQ